MTPLWTYLLLLFVAIAPLGAAAHNIFCALATLSGCVAVIKSPEIRSRLAHNIKDPLLTQCTLSLFLFLVVMVISAVWNGEASAAKITEYFLGYAPTVLLPVFASLVPSLRAPQQKRFEFFTVVIFSLLAAICLSQFMLGWRRDGFNVIQAELRARGFYSHPLTLAYVVILLWPLACVRFFRKPSSKALLALFASALVMTFTAKSRITQILTLGNLVWNTYKTLSRNVRLFSLSGIIFTCLAVIVIPNPIRTNFVETIEGKADRHALNYPDDRVAFWHAHLTMFMERPLLGFGPHFDVAHRINAYDALGLSGFEKKYASHNVYLEIAVTGGILGLTLFLWWMICVYRLIQASKSDMTRQIGRQTFWLFAIAVLTQNAWQDTEVRFVLTGLLCLLMIYGRPTSIRAET